MNKSKYVSYSVVLIFVLMLNFWLPRVLPGGPVEYIMGGGEEGAIFLTEVQKESMKAYYNLDASISEQFIDYVKGIFTLDFGMSIAHKKPVMDIILDRLPWSMLIIGISTLLTMIIGLSLGLFSALKHPKQSDRHLYITNLAISTIPEFVIGMICILLFSVNLNWFPLGGSQTAFLRSELWWIPVLDVLKHAFLPALTLTIGGFASVYILMRNEAIRVKQEPYVEFAFAKGLPAHKVAFKHIARNAALPLVTLLVIRFGGLVAGSIIVETVFSYPGIGKLLQEAILGRDYPLMHGLFLLITLFVLLMNIIADLIYPLIDPRIRKKQVLNKEGGTQ